MEADQSSYPWYAIRVRSRYEKIVSAHHRCRHRQWAETIPGSLRPESDRPKEIEAPFFPGYVFCRLNRSNRLPILMIPGGCYDRRNGKTPVPVDEAETAHLRPWSSRDFPPSPGHSRRLARKSALSGPSLWAGGDLAGFQRASSPDVVA
jgi:hypothetical protein